MGLSKRLEVSKVIHAPQEESPAAFPSDRAQLPASAGPGRFEGSYLDPMGSWARVTNCHIDSGLSGGPLVLEKTGEVVGWSVALAPPASQIKGTVACSMFRLIADGEAQVCINAARSNLAASPAATSVYPSSALSSAPTTPKSSGAP